MQSTELLSSASLAGYILIVCRDGHQADFLRRMQREYDAKNYEIEVEAEAADTDDAVELSDLERRLKGALKYPKLPSETELVIEHIVSQDCTISNTAVNKALGLTDGRSGALLMPVSKRLKKVLTAEEQKLYPSPIELIIEITKVKVGDQRVSHYRTTDAGRRVWTALKNHKG